MDKSKSHPTNQATPQRLIDELQVLRDAVVHLSLALEDYTFLVKSNQNPNMAREVRDILARLKSTTLN